MTAPVQTPGLRVWKQIGGMLERSVREIVYSPRLFARHKTLWPHRVPLGETGRFIHIDPSDPRARKKLLIDPLRKPEHPNVRFWREFIEHLQPGIALDVGVNYGECLFSAEYPQTLAVGIDANPGLWPLLEKSRSEHPQTERIQLFNAMVTDRVAPAATFYVDKRWSGTSTAIEDIAAADSDRYEQVEVACMTIDALLSETHIHSQQPTLVFKMDIEGYEHFALAGMLSSLRRMELTVGFLEIDSAYLERVGISLADYLQFLKSQFQVAMLLGSHDLKSIADVADIHAACGTEKVHIDCALLSHGTPWEAVLPAGWRHPR